MLRRVNPEVLSGANSDMRYVMHNWEKLKIEYQGEWIAVLNGKVIYHGKNPREVREQASSYKEGPPFLVRLPEKGEDDSMII